MLLRRVVLVWLLCGLIGVAWAQTTPVAPEKSETAGAQGTLSLQAKLVNLPVVVRDGKGKLMQTLTKADFALSVDGKAQTIRYFDKDNDLPLTLGLLVDVSQSQRSVLEQERSASEKFLEDMLEGGDKAKGKAPDRAFVIQFARETELLQDLTDSKPKLQAALKELDTPSPRSSGSGSGDSDDSGSGGSRHGRGGGGGTVMYDALFLSADEIMAKQTGRKALVVLTDGVDSGSKKSLARAIEAVQRGDTIVYAIYFKGEEPRDSGNRGSGGYPGGGGRRGGGGGYPGGGGGYPGGGGGGYPGGGGQRGGGGGGGESRADGKKTLERIAGETGGRMFEVTKKQDVGAIYGSIAEELRGQYRLGYTPDAATAADGYHQVDLRVPAQKKLVVQTRDGYYTGK